MHAPLLALAQLTCANVGGWVVEVKVWSRVRDVGPEVDANIVRVDFWEELLERRK